MKGQLAMMCAAGLILGLGSAAMAVECTVVDLGTFGGTSGVAYDINSVGQVVGCARNGDNLLRPFLWSAEGGMQDLGTLPGGRPTGQALAINDLGWVVGYSDDSTTTYKATLWRPGSAPRDLGSLTGLSYSYATDVNDLGQVVGVAHGDVGERHAFLWTEADGMTDLGTLGGSDAIANAVNDLGQIVGRSTLSGSHTARAFVCTDGTDMTDIYPDFPARDYVGIGINGFGAIVGQAEKTDGSKVPALWVNGSGEPVFADVPYGWANDINDSGLAVGKYAAFSGGEPSAFVWDGGSLLTTLPSLDGAGHHVAEAINNDGWIVGRSGNAQGYEVPVLWVPEPGTLSLLALGSLALLRRKRGYGG